VKAGCGSSRCTVYDSNSSRSGEHAFAAGGAALLPTAPLLTLLPSAPHLLCFLPQPARRDDAHSQLAARRGGGAAD
jgi:hypothetical protein